MPKTVKENLTGDPHSSPLRPQDQGHPVIKVYEAMFEGRNRATVSLTADGQTWIAGLREQGPDAHIGSFSSFDEAKNAVSEKLGAESGAVTWVRQEVGGSDKA